MDTKESRLLQLKGRLISELQDRSFKYKLNGKPIDHLQRAIITLQDIVIANTQEAEKELAKINEWIANLDYSPASHSANNNEFNIVYNEARKRLMDIALEELITKNDISAVVKKYFVYLKCVTFDLENYSASINEVKELIKKFELEWSQQNNQIL